MPQRLGVEDPCINVFLGQHSMIWPAFRRITAIRNEEIIQVHVEVKAARALIQTCLVIDTKRNMEVLPL